MLSPLAVVAGARKDLGFPNSCRNAGAKQMSFTVQHGELGGFHKNLEILGQGHKNNSWANPANTGKKMSGDLTVRDVVDNVLKIPAFGFHGYNPKASVRDLIPVETHR